MKIKKNKDPGAIYQVDLKRPPGYFSLFNILIYSFKYKIIETYAPQFMSRNNSFLATVTCMICNVTI